MDTTSTVPATLTSTGAPRVCTRGRLSLLTSPLLPTTPLVAMDTTSTVPATLMSTGAPRVCTRGRPSLLTSPLLPTTPLVAISSLPHVVNFTRRGHPFGLSFASPVSWVILPVGSWIKHATSDLFSNNHIFVKMLVELL